MLSVHPAGFSPRCTNDYAAEDKPAANPLTRPTQAVHPRPAAASLITTIEPSGNPQTATALSVTAIQENTNTTVARPGPRSTKSQTYLTCRHSAEIGRAPCRERVCL